MKAGPLCDVAAEAAVLSAAMLDPLAFEQARGTLRPEDFWQDAHQVIWQALQELDARGTQADVVTVASHLRATGNLDRVGGTPALASIADATPCVANVLDHARGVASLARQRRVTEAARRIAARGATPSGDVDGFCRQAEAELASASDSHSDRAGPTTLGQVAARVVEQRKLGSSGTSGPPCGLRPVDRRLGGGWGTGMHVVAGRPGMGKSAYAFQVMQGISQRAGGVGVYVSLEMPEDQLTLRAMSAASQLPLSELQSGSPQALSAMVQAAVTLQKMQVSVLFRPGATVTDVRTAARRALRDHQAISGNPHLKLAVVVVDYLQLMKAEGKHQSREQEVASVSSGLMRLVGEFQCPVIALSQLNRGVESRQEKRPLLSDLRESGSIEQDAYTVQLLYREAYYRQKEGQRGGTDEVEVIVAKQRNGPPGTERLTFRGETFTFGSPSADGDRFFDGLPDDGW